MLSRPTTAGSEPPYSVVARMCAGLAGRNNRMDKIDIRPILHAFEQFVRLLDGQRIPSHVRNFQARLQRCDAHDFTGNPTKSPAGFIFAAPIG